MSDSLITIDDLATLFISENGGDAEEVRIEIEKLFKEINALKPGDKLPLKGFGTFKRTLLDLHFDPDELFAYELNYMYAGMQSIQITPPVKELAAASTGKTAGIIESDDLPDDDLSLTFESDELISAVDDSETVTDETAEDFDIKEYDHLIQAFEQQSPEEPVEKKVPVVTEKTVDEVKTPKSDPDEKQAEIEDPVTDSTSDIKNETAALQLLDEFNDSQTKKSKEKPKVESQPVIPKEQKKKKAEFTEPKKVEELIDEKNAFDENIRQRESSKKGFIAALILIAAVVVFALIAVLVYNQVSERELTPADMPLSDLQIIPEEITEPAPVEEPAEDGDQITETSESETEAITEQPTAEEQITQITVPEGEALAQTETYGLNGEINESISSYYSIILLSVPQEAAAREFAEELREAGYRAFAYRAELSETRRTWRVGIGQFETVSNATNTVPSLPEPYRSNNFIIRIN